MLDSNGGTKKIKVTSKKRVVPTICVLSAPLPVRGAHSVKGGRLGAFGGDF